MPIDWLGNWAYRFKITIDNTKINSNLSNFPILLALGTSVGKDSQDVSHVFDELQSDANRKKIAVTTDDGETQCYVEIVKWDDANESAYLFVKVPSVSSSADTDLYLYYDSAQPDNTTYVGDVDSTPGHEVWDSSFTHVYHMTEQSNGTAGEFKDSKGANDARGMGGSPYPTRVASLVGYGQNFDPDDETYLEIPDSADFSQPTTGYLTINFWFNPDVLWFRDKEKGNSYVHVMGKGDAVGNFEWQTVFYPDDYEPAYARSWMSAYIYNPAGGIGAGASTENPPGIEIFTQAGVWYYITITIDPIYLELDVNNGFGHGSNNYYATHGIVPQDGNAPVRFGTQWGSRFWDGSIAEIRFSNVERSTAWRGGSYYSEKDELISFGVEEELEGEGGVEEELEGEGREPYNIAFCGAVDCNYKSGDKCELEKCIHNFKWIRYWEKFNKYPPGQGI